LREVFWCSRWYFALWSSCSCIDYSYSSRSQNLYDTTGRPSTYTMTLVDVVLLGPLCTCTVDVNRSRARQSSSFILLTTTILPRTSYSIIYPLHTILTHDNYTRNWPQDTWEASEFWNLRRFPSNIIQIGSDTRLTPRFRRGHGRAQSFRFTRISNCNVLPSTLSHTVHQ
jgi:hypothetical protein